MLSELDIEDRRALDALAGVVDEGLDLAEQCGWRYALAYLISERVPPNVIQRLLSGGGRVRHKRSLNEPGAVFHDHSFGKLPLARSGSFPRPQFWLDGAKPR